MTLTTTPLTGGKLGATAHKHQRIAQELRNLIEGLSPGDRLPSVVELEAHFRVANSTVEAAMRLLMQERLIERRRGSGTYVAWRKPSGVSSATPTEERTSKRRTGMVGVAAVSPPLLIVSDLLQAVEHELRRTGDSPVIILDRHDGLRMEAAFQKVRDGILDGFIHLGSIAVPIPDDVPTVILGETANNPHAWTVTVDNVQIGNKVAAHFCELGHRKMAFVTGTHCSLFGTPRLQGYREAIVSRGLAWRDDWALTIDGFPGNFEFSDAVESRLEEALAAIMLADDRPTAIFGVYDQAAVLTVRVLERLGFRVPDDVSVAGCDDSNGLGGMLKPPLTTIKLPTESLGMVAAQLLHERITLQPPLGVQPLPARALRLAGSLIVRGTTSPPCA